MRILIWLTVHALALYAAVWLVDGIRLRGMDTNQQVVTVVVVGAILGAVNATVGRVVKLLSLPFIILTLGLLWFVINGAMLLLTSSIAEALDLGLRVGGWGAAIFGGIVISVAAFLLRAVLPEADYRRSRW